MARKLDTFTDSNWNGPDPRITGGQFSDADPVGNSFPNSPNSNAGDGNKSGRQFQDSDDMYTLEGFNVINHGDSAAFNQPERNSVDVSRADRSRES